MDRGDWMVGPYRPASSSALLESTGHDGPLLYRGPCAAVSWGRQAAQRESTWMSAPFRQHRDVLSKSPAPAHGLAAHEWAASAKRGGLLFTPGILPSALRAGFAVRAAPAAQWLLFSWPRKRKVTRSPQAIESSSPCMQREHRAQAALLQLRACWKITGPEPLSALARPVCPAKNIGQVFRQSPPHQSRRSPHHQTQPTQQTASPAPHNP